MGKNKLQAKKSMEVRYDQEESHMRGIKQQLKREKSIRKHKGSKEDSKSPLSKYKKTKNGLL